MPSAGRGACAMPVAGAPPRARVRNPRTVGASSTSRMATRMPAAASRETSFTTSSECPPRRKKSSSGPTREIPITSPMMRQASACSPSSAAFPEPLRDGAGRAPRSSLPWIVTGSLSRTTQCDGTAWAGSEAAAWARIRSTSTPAPATWATSALPPARSSRNDTAAPVTAGAAPRTASTSPSSMRKPRSLTCSSLRPTKWRRPSPSRRTRSPVR